MELHGGAGGATFSVRRMDSARMLQSASLNIFLHPHVAFSSSVFRNLDREHGACGLHRNIHRKHELAVRAGPKKILFDRKCREALQAGVDKLADTISVSLGPKDTLKVINDGATIAKAIELPNAMENVGATLIREVRTLLSDKSLSSLSYTLPIMPASSSCIGASVMKGTGISPPSLALTSQGHIKCGRRPSHVLVSSGDSITTGSSFADSQNGEKPLAPSQDTSSSGGQAEKDSSGGNANTSVPKRTAPLTAREKLRAARILSRYSDSKPVKSEMGSKVLDAIREVEKGKKGLPQAPTNIFDDSKRGMPKKGLTFDFPGGFDLFVIVVSFVLISTLMFATTFFVWKVGAIHFNEY